MFLTFFLCSMCSLMSRAAASPLLSGRVDAPSGRSCDVHLHAVPDATALPLVAVAGGTGRYTTADHAGLYSRLVDDGRFAVVAFDKPGIHADAEATDGYTVEEAVYRTYTQDDLAACAVAAIGWAQSQQAIDGAAPVVLFGHSEGANVMLDVLGRLVDGGGAVGAVLLSGTPTEPFEEALRRQTGATWPSYRRAIEEGDDDYLVEQTGVASASLRDMATAPGFEAHMERLAALRVTAPIRLFHGADDTAADAAHAEETFVSRWRRVHGADRRPLDVSMRMYPACGHITCPQMTRDLEISTLAAVTERAIVARSAPGRGWVGAVTDLPPDPSLLTDIPGRYAILGLLPMGSVVLRGDQLVLMNRALPGVTLLYQGAGRFVFDHDTETTLTLTRGPRRLTIRKAGTTLPMWRMGPPKPHHARRVEGAPPAGRSWSTAAPVPTPPMTATSDAPPDAPPLGVEHVATPAPHTP